MTTVESKIFDNKAPILALFTIIISSMTIGVATINPSCKTDNSVEYSSNLKKFYLIHIWYKKPILSRVKQFYNCYF